LTSARAFCRDSIKVVFKHLFWNLSINCHLDPA
jgi:hypothetical protein